MTEEIDERFIRAVAEMRGPRTRVRRHSTSPDRPWIATSSCSTPKLGSRHLDSATGWLRSQDRVYYTIGSRATRATLPWHLRSGPPT